MNEDTNPNFHNSKSKISYPLPLTYCHSISYLIKSSKKTYRGISLKIRLLTYEIGSTTTKVRAFSDDLGKLRLISMAMAPTSISSGDVCIGMYKAKEILEKSTGTLKPDISLASSSAAGGLKMVVAGLTLDMTVRAAKEASLGAGAILYHYIVGDISIHDINKIKDIGPNIILIAGGVDFGEKKKVIEIAKVFAESNIDCPYIFAGNASASKEISELFLKNKKNITITENVYPRVDTLNMAPARAVIQKIFSKHILHAPGMENIDSLIDGEILPVPKSVMQGLEFISRKKSDIMAIDVGGATTDIHSITEGSSKFSSILIEPEPLMKRTVEGDLGIFVNAKQVVKLSKDVYLEDNIKDLKPLPSTPIEIKLSQILTGYCVKYGLERHAGYLFDYFGPTGKKKLAKGKDLTAIKYIIGTGGALSRLPGGENLIRKYLVAEVFDRLLPMKDANIIIDKDYLLGSIGLISYHNPQWALDLAETFII